MQQAKTNHGQLDTLQRLDREPSGPASSTRATQPHTPRNLGPTSPARRLSLGALELAAAPAASDHCRCKRVKVGQLARVNACEDGSKLGCAQGCAGGGLVRQRECFGLATSQWWVRKYTRGRGHNSCPHSLTHSGPRLDSRATLAGPHWHSSASMALAQGHGDEREDATASQ